MKSITYTPSILVEDALEEYLRVETDNFLRLPATVGAINGVMSYNAWRETPEGRLHLQLLTRYAIGTESVNSKQVNTIQLKLLSQGRDAKGRPRVFDSRKASSSHIRQVRLYLLDKLVAKALGLSPESIRKPFEIENGVAHTVPADTYEALQRFERWSGLTLPQTAWALYTLPDRKALHQAYPDLPHADGAVLLKTYCKARELRPDHALKDLVPSTYDLAA